MSVQTHLDSAAAFIAVAESGDAKRVAYERAADEICAAMAEDPTLTFTEVDRRLGRSASGKYSGDLVRWRTSSSTNSTPFGGRRDSIDRTTTRRIARERPVEVAKAIVKAPPAAQRQAIDHLMADPETRKVVRAAAEDEEERRARERMERANERKGQVGTPLPLYVKRLMTKFKDWRAALRFIRDEIGEVIPEDQLAKVLEEHLALRDELRVNIEAIEALMNIGEATPEDVIEGTSSRSPRREISA